MVRMKVSLPTWILIRYRNPQFVNIYQCIFNMSLITYGLLWNYHMEVWVIRDAVDSVCQVIIVKAGAQAMISILVVMKQYTVPWDHHFLYSLRKEDILTITPWMKVLNLYLQQWVGKGNAKRGTIVLMARDYNVQREHSITLLGWVA